MRVASLIALLVGMTALSAPEASAETGWRPLFNGKDLSGWRGYKTEVPPGRWRVQNGALVLGTEGTPGDLVTIEQFGDFDLEFEWKIAPGGNSGVFYFVQEDSAARHVWSTGAEMQVLDDEKHADGKLPSHRAGALYDLIAPSKAAARPPGSWNSARITVRNGRIEHWLNGTMVVSTQWGDQQWNDLVAGSKFKAMPGFAKLTRGHLALQDHGDQVAFRNIRVRTP